MATTFKKLKRLFDESGTPYESVPSESICAFGVVFEPDEIAYRDEEGEPRLQFLVRLEEEGRYLLVLAPRVWNVADCPHRQAACEVAAAVQARMKLIRFDLSDTGWLSPNIEIPLEESPLGADQLKRCLAGVLMAVKQYDPVFRHVIETGEIDFDLTADIPPPSDPADMLRVVGLADDAGGVDALERLLGGETPADGP